MTNKERDLVVCALLVAAKVSRESNQLDQCHEFHELADKIGTQSIDYKKLFMFALVGVNSCDEIEKNWAAFIRKQHPKDERYDRVFHSMNEQEKKWARRFIGRVNGLRNTIRGRFTKWIYSN